MSVWGPRDVQEDGRWSGHRRKEGEARVGGGWPAAEGRPGDHGRGTQTMVRVGDRQGLDSGTAVPEKGAVRQGSKSAHDSGGGRDPRLVRGHGSPTLV